MQTNNAYSATITSEMEKASIRIQPVLRLAKKRPLPSSAEGINDYIECLLRPQDECLLTDAEQQVCDWATD